MMARLMLCCLGFWAMAQVQASTAFTGPTCDKYSFDQTLNDSDLRLCWRIEDEAIVIRMIHPNHVWISVGFGTAMTGSDAIVARPDTGTVIDTHIVGRQLDDVKPDAQQNLSSTSVVYKAGYTVVEFTRPLKPADDSDVMLNPDDFESLIWAVGDGRNFGLHIEFGLQQIRFSDGKFAQKQLPLLLVMHALLMTLAWLILSPAVILVTRYCKVTAWQNFPEELDNKFWWRIHWIGHSAIVVTAVIAVIVAFIAVGGINLSPLHAKLGIAVLLLSLNQILLGMFRGSKGGPVDKNGKPLPEELWRGDHYDMTLYRRGFEFLHKNLGYVTLLVAQLTIYTGLFLFELNGYFYLAVFLIQCLFMVLMAFFMRKGLYINSYQAIWGYDPVHPGNRKQNRQGLE